jgi:hypothetical protein
MNWGGLIAKGIVNRYNAGGVKPGQRLPLPERGYRLVCPDSLVVLASSMPSCCCAWLTSKTPARDAVSCSIAELEPGTKTSIDPYPESSPVVHCGVTLRAQCNCRRGPAGSRPSCAT